MGNNINIRAANKSDLDGIVQVHVDAFPGFFITLLGDKFISVMYDYFLSEENSFFFVAEDDKDQICSFAVGCYITKKIDYWLLLKFVPRFAFSLLPVLIKSPFEMVRKLLIRLTKKDGSPIMPTGSVLLRSIALKRACWGKGIAPALLRQFENAAFRTGARAVVLTTDADSNDRTIGFYEKCGYVINQAYQQDTERNMLLLCKPRNLNPI